MTSFEVFVSKETFKFHAAHFVAFQGYRERLHGHNYKVGVRILGSRKIAADGYVVDFGNIKNVTNTVCKELNEHFLCPTLSDVLDVSIDESEDNNNKGSVTIVCQDGSSFVFPRKDCAMLPIVHATTEELAIYLWSRILEGLNSQYLLDRGIHTMEVTVAEAIGQEAVFRHEIPANMAGPLDIKSFILEGEVKPCPAAPDRKESKNPCQGNCETCQREFTAKLQRLAEAINNNTLSTTSNASGITIQDLEAVMGKF